MNHNLNHYVIGATALVLGLGAYVKESPNHNIVVQAPVAGHVETVKPSRFTWPALGQNKTIALGEAITGASPGKVTIFCSSFECRDFRTDLDDAFQIANWKASFEDRPVDSESDVGIFVGPAGPDANKLAAAIFAATGVTVSIVPIEGVDGLGVIIGKHE